MKNPTPAARYLWLLKTPFKLIALGSILLTHCCSARAQGTAFTYQGRLNDGAAPANGLYDLRFTTYEADSGGNLRGLLTNSAVAVSNGLFTTTLDFGFGVFNGGPRWLELAVRSNGSAAAFTPLTPRQAVLPAPYAVQAANAGTAATANSVLGLAVNTNLSSVALGTGNAASAAFATVSGGTANNANAAYATVSGGSDNIASGQRATVGGGYFNTASGDRSVVAGGYANEASGYTAFVGAGLGNRASGNYATLGGGDNNLASGGGAFVGGGSANQATNTLATVPGGENNLAGGQYSLAAGQRAKAIHDGAFVWADHQAADFTSTAADQFLIRALGGVGINTNNPNGAALAVNGNVTSSGTFTGNGAGLTDVNLTLNSGGAMTWPGSFVLASSPATGFNPSSVTTADVNGDGKPDLISADVADRLTVLTNNGSGGFVFSSTLGVGTTPVSVTAADVNGDGKPDLISANYNANTLTVLTNNGNGGFVLSATLGVGTNPISVTAADVNGDGKPDLINADGNFFGTLKVLTNNGGGGFVMSSSLVVGSDPTSVIAADVNGDGKLDLISTNPNGNKLTILTNNGSGGFLLASSPNVAGSPWSVSAADVNRDGTLDLISANANAASLSVLTNNGNGGFMLASSPDVGLTPFSVTSVDVNGDGRPDLVSANYDSDTLSVLTNNGSGGFVPASTPSVGSEPNSVIALDVNDDGRPDLISANYGANTLSVLFNTATFTGSFAGNGSGLTSVQAGNLAGTVADARLSANVALRAGGNTFTGNQTIAGNVGIGLPSPDYQLDVQAAQAVGRFTTINNANGAVLSLRNNTAAPTYLGAINFEDSGTPGQIGYLASGQMTFRVAGADKMNLQSGGLSVDGSVTATAFNPSSDRNLKENFAPVNPRAVLEKVAGLPISRWNFKGDSATSHVGPMAQDFHATFALGTDERHIATVDADGVALAAIQGLNQKVEETRAENAALRRELSEIKQLLTKLAAKGN